MLEQTYSTELEYIFAIYCALCEQLSFHQVRHWSSTGSISSFNPRETPAADLGPPCAV